MMQSLKQVTSDAKLVIIDPISAYLSNTDSHKNSQIRALLSPLRDLAARRGVAIVLITHLSKGGGSALYRAMDSIGFIAAARAAWLFGRDKEHPERLMLRLKGNLAAEVGGLAYSLEGRTIELDDGREASTVRLKWEHGSVHVSADEILAADSVLQRSECAEAVEWLKLALGSGPRLASEIITEVRKIGIADVTLRRARNKLGVKTAKWDFKGGWKWSLPTDKDAESTEDAHAEGTDHLRPSHGRKVG